MIGRDVGAKVGRQGWTGVQQDWEGRRERRPCRPREAWLGSEEDLSMEEEGGRKVESKKERKKERHER